MSNNVYQNLMEITAELVEIIHKETELLYAHQVSEAQALLLDKQKLAEQHQFICKQFNEQDITSECTVEELQALKELIDRLHACLLENKQALEVAQTVRNKIIDKISQAVKEDQAPTCHYNKTARFDPNLAPVTMLALNLQI
ncbi:hypothetical protein [Candidatus Odyssella thessalonicensis]|uniref:hypothetical protein n=1 Tax=Candidatus Odyssella thessalonicensis TaxID=84647 RepID=UPI000225B70D|nr:hypothetical protein [Candidatus Odyssella thessalonicensis]